MAHQAERRFWNEAVETRSEADIAALQIDKIRRQVARCYALSPYYRDKMDACGAAPEDVRTWEDYQALPVFLTPDDYRRQQHDSLAESGHAYGRILCVRPDEVAAVSTTSGTTGTPTITAYTRRDIATTNEVLARAFWRIGIRPGDRVLHGFGLSMWVAGVPFVRALEAMGALPIPVGAEGGTERLLLFARLMRPSALLCTPSFAEYLIERAPQAGVEVGELGIERIFCAGEPGAGLPAVRKKIQEAWGAQLYDFAGGPWGISGVSCAHADYQGMHLLSEDCMVPYDLIDPETGRPVPVTDGAVGAQLITAYDWEAAPPLKFQNNDVIQIFTEPCPCGLPGKRKKILGRIDDLLIVKGVNLYPAALRNLVNGFIPRVTGELRIVLTEPPPRVVPPLHIKVEAAAGLTPGEVEALRGDIERKIGDLLRIAPRIELVAPGSLARTALKSKLIEKAYERS